MAAWKICARCKTPITHALLIAMDYGYCSSTCRERDILGIHFDSLQSALGGIDEETRRWARPWEKE